MSNSLSRSLYHFLLGHPDFRSNPVKALWRRVVWKLRWKVSDRPWTLPLGDHLKIAVPRCGAGAAMYYRGFSEPEAADFIARFLKPGMVFLDVGAHLGEYTLLASRAVGSSGEVHAFEPNPGMFRLLRGNVERNNLGNVVLNNCAVSEVDGESEFQVSTEPGLSSLKRSNDSHAQDIVDVMRVRSIRLDSYWSGPRKKIDLVKVDVEGAELLVLRGMEKLLSPTSREGPVLIFEYEPSSYVLFGYRADDVYEWLNRHGYHIVGHCDTPNLLACRDEARLRSTLATT